MISEVECSDFIRQQVMQQKRQDEENMPHIRGTNPHRSFAGRSEGFKKISKVRCDWDQDVMRTAKPAVHASKIITNSWNSRISNSYKFLQILTNSYKFLHILQENGLPLSFRAFTRFEHISDSQPQFLSSSAGDAQNVLYTLLILAEDSLNVVYYDP